MEKKLIKIEDRLIGCRCKYYESEKRLSYIYCFHQKGCPRTFIRSGLAMLIKIVQ